VSVRQKKSWVNSGARFCVSCVITLACWAVWLVLGVTLAGLSYIALSRELPVPGFLLRRIETELAASGFELQFGRARLDPTGKVLLEDVSLRSRQFEDPLLECRLLYVRHDFWSLLSARPSAMEIQVEGASLQLPAMLSATGTAEPLVRNLTARVHHEHHLWQIERLACEIGNVRVTVHGSYAPAQRGGEREFILSDLAGSYLAHARKVAPFLHQLEAFEDPSLQIQISPERVDLLLTAAAAHEPWGVPLVTGPLVAGTTMHPNRPGDQSVRLQVTARQVNYDEQLVAGRLRASLHANVSTSRLSGRALELDLAASTITVAGEQLLGPLVHVDLAAWPAVRGGVKLMLDGEFLAVSADAQLAERSARLHAEGRVGPDVIARTLTTHTPRAAPYFVFDEPVWFQADATFTPGWKFAGVSSRVAAGRLDSRGVKVTAARGRIDIKGTDFLAYDAYAQIGADNFARGSYWMDFASTDYRMLLEGQLRPVEIAGWFKGDWWPTFWNRYFAFPTPPVANVDVQGRWRDGNLSNNFVVARSGPASVWGGDFEHVDATVFVRPGFVHGWNLDATREAGRQRVTGSFKRTVTPGVRDGSRFEFDLAGNPPPGLVGRMLEGRANDVIALVALTQPPDMHAWGVIDGSETSYRFTGRTTAPLHFLNFPLDQGSVSGSVQGTSVKLDQIDFTAAGGTGRMRATVSGTPGERRLGFDLFVNAAKLSDALHAYEEYDALNAGRAYVASPDTKFVRKAGNSRLDFSLSAQGTPGSLVSFTGSGNAALTGAELGEVHLFGLLSQVLSGLTLSFSSLKLDAVRTSFQLKEGAAYFPDVKVTGPSAVIDGRGKYSYVTNALDFNAKFKPYDQPGSLLAAAVGLVMNPLTSILELRLTGPLGDPKWSVDITGPMSSSHPNDQGKPPVSTKPPATDKK
jgi:hypothetical protein